MDHPALFTDLYQLTMAQAYLQSGTTGSATFSLYFRSYPPDRAYYVLGGVDDALDYLESLRFTGEDLDYLESLDLFDDGFLEHLGGLRFTGNVRAMKEGSIFFAGEPVMEVTAPIIEAQIVETRLLNQFNLQTILATKASRVVHAARGRTVVDFAARRTQGAEASNKLARAAYVVGFAGTSNVLAGKMYGIPVFGTMAHSFIEAFESEEDALRAYARSFPDNSTFLVDTYDTLEGVKKAAKVASAMASGGHSLQAIRLDSGDLLDLAIRSREILDRAGHPGVRIFASGGLDEYEVDRLLREGAPIDGFGRGNQGRRIPGRAFVGLHVQAGGVRRAADSQAQRGQGNAAGPKAGVPFRRPEGPLRARRDHSGDRIAASWRVAAPLRGDERWGQGVRKGSAGGHSAQIRRRVRPCPGGTQGA